MNGTFKEIEQFKKKFQKEDHNKLAQRAVLNSEDLSDLLSDKIKKKTITRTLRFSPGELYSLEKVQQTRNNLLNLKIFNSVNISFKKNENKKIYCNIFLKQQKKLYYRIEAEGTNSSGNYGTSLNFMFGNKNTFKGAENFNFKFKGALETRKNLSGQVLQSLISERLQHQEARKLGIRVTNQEVENNIKFIEKQNNMPENQLIEALFKNGVPKSALPIRLKSNLIILPEL